MPIMDVMEVPMELIILALILAVGPLAVLYGADSRPLDTQDRPGRWRHG